MKFLRKTLNPSFRCFLLIFLLSGCTSFQNKEEEIQFLFTEGAHQEELGNKEEAQSYYEKVTDLQPKHFEAQTRLGQLHFAKQEFDEAEKRFRFVLNFGEARNPNIKYWLATTFFKEKKLEAALAQLEDILSHINKRYFYAYRLALQICLLEPRFYEKGLALANQGIKFYASHAEFYRARGEFLAKLGQEDNAILAYEEAKRMDELLIDFEPELVLLYVKKGRYLDALKTWDRKIVKKYLWAEDNLQSKLFENLYKSVDVFHSLYPNAYFKGETLEPKQKELLLRLGIAFKNVGWVREAKVVFERILKEDPDHKEAQNQKKHTQQFLSFLDAFRNYFYHQYEVYETSKDSTPILTVVKKIQELAKKEQIKELDERPISNIETIMLVYNYIELTVNKFSPLTRYFNQFNHYLLLFNFFGPTETNVKHILAWLPGRKKRVWGKDYTYELFICEHSEVYHYKEKEVLSSFGGLCLTDHSFWLDLDTYRRISIDIYKAFRRERLKPEPGYGADVLAVRYSSELQSQLAYEACNQLLDNFEGSPDNQKNRFIQKILEQLMEVAEYHELGHICKHQQYIPPTFWERLNPVTWGTGISLLVSEGFSDKLISIWSEEKAQLTALKHSRAPYLALYRTIGSMVKDPEVSRHSAGYHRIIRGYVKYIANNTTLFPQIDCRQNIMEQLYKLKPQEIRNIAEYLY